MTPADLAALLRDVTLTVVRDRGLDENLVPDSIVVERPRHADHGDYSTNVALQMGKRLGVNPRELAGWLAEAFAAAEGVAKAEIAGPGFVNLWLGAAAQNTVVAAVLDGSLHTLKGIGDGQARDHSTTPTGAEASRDEPGPSAEGGR